MQISNVASFLSSGCLRLPVGCLVVFLAAFGGGHSSRATAALLPEPYAQSGWPCQHHDPLNSDWIPVTLPEFLPAAELPTVRWILREPDNPTVEMVVGSVARAGTNEVMYVTAGKVLAPNLRAFRMSDGAELWHATPPTNAADAGPNSAALTSSATLDSNGRMYLADSKYLYCYDTGTNLDTQGNRPFVWRAVLPHLKVYNTNTSTWVASTNDADPTAFAKPFLSLVFTPLVNGQAYVGGITIDGSVFFFNRTNGAVFAAAHLQSPPIPMTNAPEDPFQLALEDDPLRYDSVDTNMPFGIWCTRSNTDQPDLDYFMNPVQIATYLAANTGGTGTMVANTPVIIPDPLRSNVSRLYVCATQSTESATASSDTNRNDAMVYRVDFDPTLTPTNRLKVMNYQYALGQPRFAGRMPNGENSATSPDISPNQRWLFTADRGGYLYCFDVNDGSIVWRWKIGASMGSPTTFQNPDAQGRFKLFCFGDYQMHVFEVESLTGRVATNFATGEAFHRVLDLEPYLVSRYWRTNDPGYDATYRTTNGVPFERVAVGASYMVGTSNRLLAVYTMGWHNPKDTKGIWLIPTHSVLAVVNPAAVWTATKPEGALEAVYMDTNGTCEVSFIPSADGAPRAAIYYGSQSTTFAQFLEANDMMPDGMKPLYLRPFGGVRIVEIPYDSAPNAAPTVALHSPANESHFLPGAPIELSGSNHDPDGRIGAFCLFTNGVPMITNVLDGAWRITWTPSNSGTYTFQAEVYDNDGVRATSAPVVVHVSVDTDGDRLPDSQELALGTDPSKRDSDLDGCADGAEFAAGTNPLSVSDYPRLAAPALVPPPGTYFHNLLVTLTNSAPGSTIRYTAAATSAGVLPTTNSPLFIPGTYFAVTNHASCTNDPNPADATIPLTPVSLTIMAQAVGAGGVSTVVTGQYVLNKVLPTFGIAVAPPPTNGGTKHQLDIYHPRGRTNNRVLIFVYGGAWKQGDKDMYLELGNTFAGYYGLTTVLANYELSDTNNYAVHPAHINDVANAFAWTREHIGEYGGDTNRIFLFGQSAGGHLVSLLTTDRQYLDDRHLPISAIRGVVSMSGAYQLPNLVQVTNNPLGLEPLDIAMYQVLAINTFGSNDVATLGDASPATYVRTDQPPFHLIHAWEDMPGFSQECRDFYDQLVATHAPVSLLRLDETNIPPQVALLGFPFGGHYTEIYAVNTRDWDSLSTRTVVDFVDSLDPNPDPPAVLQTSLTGDALTLTWPLTKAALFLESATSLTASGWTPVLTQPTLADNRCTVTIHLTGEARFYRLRSY